MNKSEVDYLSAGEDENFPVSRIYKISVQALKALFQNHYLGGEQVLINVPDVVRKLASETNTGIVGDFKDIRRRKKEFGENTKPTPPVAKMGESIVQALSNFMWVAIGITAILSSGVSLFFMEWKSVWEGISIILVAVFLIAIIAGTDYVKDQKYIELTKKIKEEQVAVIRGKLGATQSISIWDVVVGDVVLLDTGASVPADSLIIEQQDLFIDEPEPTNPVMVDGVVQKPRTNVDKSKNPFLVAGSIVRHGQCKALVCNVGVNSTRGIEDKKLETEKDTALQKKLKNLENQFVKFAAFSCMFVLILIIVMLVVKITGKTPWYKVLFQQSLQYANLLVVLFVVVVPEGLPLTIGVSLAYSTGRMFSEDRILVKELEAPEKMGEVNEILVGKTSTITTGKMKVAEFLCEDKIIMNTRKSTLMNCELSNITLELIKESILFNCTARVEMDATTYKPVGNPTEVGLLRFLQDADQPIHLLIQQKLGRIRAVSPFSSYRKRSVTAIQNPNRPDTITVYLKGAPEVVLDMCTSYQSADNIEPKDLDNEKKEEINGLVDDMAYMPMRVIAFGFFEMEEKEWNETFQKNYGNDFEKALEDGIIQFTFLGAFGLKDPLRPNIKSVVNAIKQRGHVKVRMISGDHYETAKKIAVQCGILSNEDLMQNRNCIMDADDFRRQVGELDHEQVYQDEQDGDGTATYTLDKQDSFKQFILEDVKVLSRANPDDKLKFVIGLKNCEKTVAATGEGINDVSALEQADVGLAMGSGCSAAKSACDLILTEDDFESAIRAIMWGRNIYHNVGKFLQFQLTVNVSVLLLVISGIAFFGECPLNAVQLLWVNLIMDTFAAIALSTEPPLEKILKTIPSSNTAILTASIWRQVLGVSIWNFLIILAIYLFGGALGGLEPFHYYSDKVSTESFDPLCNDLSKIQEVKDDHPVMAEKCQPYWSAQAKLRVFTYVLCTFVFLQIFNYINCRKIGQSERNVFEKLFSKFNWYFWLTIIFVTVFQVTMVQWFFVFTRTTPLNRAEWSTIVMIGASVIPISFLLKFTGKGLLERIPCTRFIDEDKIVEDGFVNTINKINDMQVSMPRRSKQEEKPNDLEQPDNDYQPM